MDAGSCGNRQQIQPTRRRRFVGAAGAGLIAMTAGCSSAGDVFGNSEGESSVPDSEAESSSPDDNSDTGDKEDGSDSSGESDSDDRNDDETEVATIEPQSFSGSGQATRSGVSIEGGPTVLTVNYTGGSNFRVTLRGDEADVPFISRDGNFSGDVADVVPAGEFELEIIATGEWEVDVKQPRAAQGESLPASFEASGVDVVGPVQFSGTNTVTIEYAGDDTLIVGPLLMSNDGSQVSGEEVPILVQDTGPFTVERTFSSDAVGWILSRGTGEWSVEIE